MNTIEVAYHILVVLVEYKVGVFMKILRLGILSFFLFSNWLLANTGADAGFCDRLLQNGTVQVLKAAIDTGGFQVKILQGTVEGKPRFLVMLGESYLKSETQAKAGKDILQKFNAYGLEGADFSKYIGGKVFHYSRISLDLYLKIITLGYFRAQSTIYTARDAAIIQESTEQIQASAKKDLKKIIALEDGHKVSKFEHFASILLPLGMTHAYAQLVTQFYLLGYHLAYAEYKQAVTISSTYF